MLKQRIDFSLPLQCVRYGRMSNEDPNRRSPDQQFDQIQREVRRQDRPWVTLRDFRDDGVKGAYITRRPQFHAMLTAIRSGELRPGAILVDTLERFGRSAEISPIREELWARYGVLVLTADSNFADPTTMAGKALGFVEQVRATAGSEVKAHDVWRGKLDKARQKKWPGGPVPFGKRLARTVVVDGREGEVADSDLADDPATDWIALRAYAIALANLGRGGGFIAARLNADDSIPAKYKPFRGDTINYWLDNPICFGRYRWAAKCTGIRNDTRVQQKNPDGPD